MPLRSETVRLEAYLAVSGSAMWRGKRAVPFLRGKLILQIALTLDDHPFAPYESQYEQAIKNGD